MTTSTALASFRAALADLEIRAFAILSAFPTNAPERSTFATLAESLSAIRQAVVEAAREEAASKRR